MKYYNLAKDIKVSKICLGSMTWGSFNSKKQTFAMLDYAYDRGINFVDTAELYPSPPSKKTQFLSECYLGEWIKQNKKTGIVISSKIAGYSPMASYIRKNLSYCDTNLNDALNNSLKRLNKDCIDLYQPHWPYREANFFNVRNFADATLNNLREDKISNLVYDLDNLVKQGKIRTYGVSNETSWGLMKYLNEASKNNLSKASFIQNPYSLLTRSFEIALSEVSIRENINLLAYSPLAFGVLSGKYQNKTDTKNSRLNTSKHYKRYSTKQCGDAVKRYYELAKELNISLVTLSIAFVLSRSFVGSVIIGATSLEQLKQNIDAIEYKIDNDIFKKIDYINELSPNPGI